MKKILFLQGTVFSTIVVMTMIFFVLPGVSDAAQKELSINNNAQKTTTRDVTLAIYTPVVGATAMKVSNDISFEGIGWEPYTTTKKWKVTVGSGVKSVYVLFRKKDGTATSVYTDTIELSVPQQMAVSVDINNSATSTKSRNVILQIAYSGGIEEMFISNAETFDAFDSLKPATNIPWILSSGSGEKTVYAQFRDANGKTKTVSDTITYTEPPGTLPPGSLLKSPQSSLYYLGYDGMLHPFLHSAVFHSWYEDMDAVDIRQVSAVVLRQYSVGKPVCIRGGTWLVKFQNFPQLYAVEIGCQLFPLRSEIEAYLLYGKDWKKRVITLDNQESGIYTTYERGIHDTDNAVIDKDRDGLDKDTEALYGSSDSLPDTDGDGLSDIEESLVWLTDPALPDTDGNGREDMQDIISTYLETGNEVNGTGVYMYPSGMMVYDGKKYYMSYADHLHYSIGNTLSVAAFTTNNLSPRFVVQATPSIPIMPRAGWSVKPHSHVLPYPNRIGPQGNVYAL